MNPAILWDMLTTCIDYHHKKWYEYTFEIQEWEQCGIGRVMQLLDKIAPNKDHGEIIKQFYYRDTEAHARPKD